MKQQKQFKIVSGPWMDQIGTKTGTFKYNGQEMTVIKIRKQKNDGEFFHAYATVQNNEYTSL